MKNKTIIIGLVLTIVFSAAGVSAQTIAPNATENPSKSDFKIVDCDGPALPATGAGRDQFLATWKAQDPTGQRTDGSYKACDFNGALSQIQHLINIMVVLGVLVAILLFSYAGYLMVSVSFTGKTEDVKKAYQIFENVAIGFIIMLAAWFVVYQIISWLAGSSSAGTALLSK